MPELPEVETVMRGLAQAVEGKIIRGVRVNRYDLRRAIPDDVGQVMTGACITGFTRRGKYIVMGLGRAHVMVLHLGMSGRVRIFAANQDYEPRTHDHVVITMDDGVRFAFEDPRRFGMLYYDEYDSWAGHAPFVHMGAEPLEAWSGADLYAALRRKKSPIKAALLDQRVVAGLGNIYVCEALYRVGIDPRRLSCDVTQAEAVALVPCVQDVLREAIAAGGSTLRDYRHTDGSLGYFQHGFAVYDKEGQGCQHADCRDTVVRIVQSGRSTFYCPSCQG